MKEKDNQILPTRKTLLGGGILGKENPGGKRKKILLTIGIISLIGLLIGVSYAWWSYTAYQSGINKVASDCLKITITEETSAIQLEKAYPLRDAEASMLTPYTFTLTNICSYSSEYSVHLEIMDLGDNQIDSQFLSMDFNEEGKKNLSTGYTSVDPTYNLKDSKTYNSKEYTANDAKLLTSGILGPNKSVTYNLRIWIDEKVTIEDEIENKEFIGKVSVTNSLVQLATNNLAELLIEKSKTDTNIEKIEHEATEQTPALTDYRFMGIHSDNYVCFGYEGETKRCPDDNLYRIIGVIPTQSSENGSYENRIKLVKEEYYIGSTALKNSQGGVAAGPNGYGYSWGTTDDNRWENSPLIEVLNEEYYSKLGEYQNYIEPAKWYLGAPNGDQLRDYTFEDFYTKERSNSKGYSGGNISYINNIGLLYPSDFRYVMERSNSIKENWLYNLKDDATTEWLITPDASPVQVTENDSRPRVFAVFSWGVSNRGVGADLRAGIRPTFYLKTEVQYKSGTGSIDNPYYISL